MLSEENNLGFYSKLIQKEWIAEVEVALTGFDLIDSDAICGR